MSAYSCRRLPGLLLIAALPCWTAPALAAAATDPAGRSGGYLVFSDFTVDAEKHVISPPATARAGDLLQIRPLRLNDDEYLILQKCTSADCTKAEVVRAWNSGGYMGPYPVLSDKIPIKAGAKYMLWMQRVPTRGVENFSLYQRDSPPLVFTPAGSPRIFEVADLKAAREHGPSRITTALHKGSTFVATFEGGSVVRMQLLRAESKAPAF